MDTKLLNKYLAGDALPEEKREVVRWMKESEEHREQLMQMRHIYDATIWNGNLQEKKAENKKIMMRYLWASMKIAAVIAMIAFIIHKEYQEYRFEHSTEMQMMTVPAGQRASLVLADGTIVWLNSNSTLKYPATGFHAKERKVILEGEGYFEVTKQNGKQFTVKTHEYDVVVKGTKFNVSAYSDDSYITTTLLEGAVELNYKEDQIRMSPGESISLDLVTRQLKGKKVNARQAMAWAEDRIEYDDITLGEMVKKLSRQYDVHIQLESEKLGDMKFRVSLRNKETIVDVMDALKEIIPIKVEYKEKDIYIR